MDCITVKTNTVGNDYANYHLYPRLSEYASNFIYSWVRTQTQTYLYYIIFTRPKRFPEIDLLFSPTTHEFTRKIKCTVVPTAMLFSGSFIWSIILDSM